MIRKPINAPDLSFSDDKLNRLMQFVRSLTQEVQKVQAVLDEGITGQVLTKISAKDYDIDWAEPTGGGGGDEECHCDGENVGGGVGGFFGREDGVLQFYTLLDGTNITLDVDEDAGTVTINASGGGGGVVNWADIVGTPATFPPAAHVHAAATVTFDDSVALLGETEVQGAIEALTALIDAIAFTPTKDTRGASFVSNVALTTAVNAVPVYIPYNCTIESVVVTTTGGPGAVVVDIWKDSFANYPPDVTDTITAAAKPTIAAGIKYQDSTLTGWTTSLSAGDILIFKLDSVSTFTGVFVQLILQPI